MLNVFFKENEDYSNQLNPVKGYLEQLTQFIATKKSIPIEEAKTKAIEFLKCHFKDKAIKYFERKENGDRIVKNGTLLGYMKENIKDNNILAPTFTSYMNSSVKKSILSEFVFINVKRRSAAKEVAQKAKAEGNEIIYNSKNNLQVQMKTYNNALSGSFAQEACILHNPTAHSTMTSITRTITSISNACNEKALSGNRYYPRPIDVLNNIVYITTYANLTALTEVVNKYGLHIPTIDEVVSVLKRSSNLYFKDDAYYNKHIIPYLEKLPKIQLAGICYYGDLYHLRKFNDSFMRSLIKELITPDDAGMVVLEDFSAINKIPKALLYFTHHLFFSKLKGKGKDYGVMNKEGLVSGIIKTAENLTNTFMRYKDFFNTFFMTEYFPGNSHRLKYMRRKEVVLSDTDSTCFTLDEWVIWYKGRFWIDDESIALAGSLSYIASQSIVNQLAILSKNMNVEVPLLKALEMKNEFLWLCIAPAEVSKHYYAYTSICEGNVYKEPSMEIKGAHLRNSAVPPDIIAKGNELMKYIVSSVSNNESVKLHYVIKTVIDIENEIIESISSGKTKFLKKSKIKEKTAYSKNEFESPYQRHKFWIDIFAPKYGNTLTPPYDVVKIPTTITSKTALNNWINSIEDQGIRMRLIDWLTVHKKKDLPTIYLNEMYVEGHGIPKELAPIIDLKRIVLDVTLQQRLIIETLGVMLQDGLYIKEQFQHIFKKD